ncbi:large proline-rich protein BAG6 isoform X2 [Bacillus rossius redtenbacheri]|uniref:large proline-rich protein BAG6 isoform X2 n=1 Tax=Bacillus rossius redtenbacheri TaxID=93214 RepID=UPI002FDEFE82
MIDLTVKTLDSQNHPFSVPDDTTVKQLKERIAETINVPVDVQRMIYCGRVLQDEKALSEYDVNGKVIHLVQRPPPQPGAPPPGPDQPSRAGPSPPGRRAARHPRIDGNAMYLGAMAFPADLMDAQGIQPPQPSHSLSRSRLTLAMQMLTRAKATLTKLESPEGQESPGAETPPEEPDEGEPGGQPEGGVPEAPEAASTSGLSQAAAAIAAAVSASQASGVPSITIVRGGEERDVPTAPPPAGEDLDVSEREEVVPEGEGQGPQPPAEDRASPPHAPVMAGVMDELGAVQERLLPFLQQYHRLMRDDPAYDDASEARSAQRVFFLVSEVMHFLSHAYHAMSDIMCDFSSPPPRILRCRPVLIQHSAVLQAGIPIQAQFNLVANRGTNTGNGQFVMRDADSTTEAPAAQAQTQAPAGAAEASDVPRGPGDDAPVPRENGGGSSPPSEAPGDGENLARSRTRGLNGSFRPRNSGRSGAAQSRARTPRTVGGTFFSPQSFSISPADVEVFMEVGPSSITIDSMETRVLDGSVMGGGGEQAAGANFPAPEFIQNLMQAMAGHVMGRVGTPVGTAAAAPVTASASGTASGAQAQAQAGQNSQARGNTATHPTTATQTRSTSRPHVHLAPSAVHSALGTSNFDPFLPCNSHHIRSGRRRLRAPRLGPAVTFTTDRSPRGAGGNAQQPEQAARAAETPPPPPPAAQAQPPPAPQPNLLGFLDVFGGLAANIAAEGAGGPPGEEGASGLAQLLRGLLGATPDNTSGMQSLLQGLPLFQVFSGGAEGQTPSLVDLLQSFAAQPESEGEHLLTDFMMTLARGLTFQDLCLLRAGDTRPLQALRPQLREFAETRVLQGEAPSSESVARGVDRLLGLLRPHFDTLLEARIREDVDIISTVNLYHQVRLPEILELFTSEGENGNFGSATAAWWRQYTQELQAILLYCCVDKAQGLEAIVRSYVMQITQGVSPLIQQTTVNCCLGFVRGSVAQLAIGPEEIQPYVVYRMGSADTQQASVPPEQQMETDVEVDTDAAQGAQPAPEVRDEVPEVPEVLLGSEAWHGQVPSEWVPIISRDVQRQRRQGSQPPFSDAYLSGMPSKRRKVVTSAKPQGNLNQAITDTVRSAIETAGVGPGPLREVASQAAGSDPAIQAAYADRVRSLVQDRLAASPDFSSDRFPNTAKYFSK